MEFYVEFSSVLIRSWKRSCNWRIDFDGINEKKIEWRLKKNGDGLRQDLVGFGMPLKKTYPHRYRKIGKRESFEIR